jgi:hypothetical protein
VPHHNRTHAPQQTASLDHLVGRHKQRGGNVDAERLRSHLLRRTVAQAGSGVDCQATNFQPWGVFVQALRNNSLRLRGWPPISASIAARPVMSATSPKTRTLRSLQFAALYFVLPDFIESSQLALVSVLPEECV